MKPPGKPVTHFQNEDPYFAAMAAKAVTMSRRRLAVTLVLFLPVVFSAAPGRAGFSDLVRHLPDGANTLILFNVEEILASPLGVKEGWAAKQQQAFAANWLVVPPGTRRFAMSARLELTSMHPLWQAGVAELDFEPSMVKAAALHGGSVDEIDQRAVAALPPDIYVVQFAKQLAGYLMPANRQDAGRWIEEVYSDSGRVPLSAYLAEGVGFADKLGTPIIVAVDLKHIFPASFIRTRLESLESLKGQTVDLDQLAAALASIRGMTLGMTVTDQVYGKVKVDFDQDVPLTPELAKPLLLEALANHGAMIEEFTQWECAVSGKDITLGGYLQDSGRRRIFSLLDAPPELHSSASPSPSESQASDRQYAALASQQYFKSVTGLLGDLRGKRNSDEYVSWGQVGLWFEKYAAKIDQLPILHVDPELVDWGANVSAQLRQAESAMKGIGARTGYRLTEAPNIQAYDVRTATAYGAGVGPYGGYRAGAAYGYQYAYNPQLSLALQGQQSAQIRTQERIRGNTSANLIVQGLQAETGEIRRKMTEKYQVEF
mgnify:CR=1 FL=1